MPLTAAQIAKHQQAAVARQTRWANSRPYGIPTIAQESRYEKNHPFALGGRRNPVVTPSGAIVTPDQSVMPQPNQSHVDGGNTGDTSGAIYGGGAANIDAANAVTDSTTTTNQYLIYGFFAIAAVYLILHFSK